MKSKREELSKYYEKNIQLGLSIKILGILNEEFTHVKVQTTFGM